MKCIKCGSENVTISMEQTGGKTKTNNMGCLWSFGRFWLIICTCGLWLLVGKRKNTGKTAFKNKKIALCQKCGHKWTLL